MKINDVMEKLLPLKEKDKNLFIKEMLKKSTAFVKGTTNWFFQRCGTLYDRSLTFEDLFSISQYCFVKAALAYDVSKNKKFSAYAFTCMKRGMFDEIRRVHISPHWQLEERKALKTVTLEEALIVYNGDTCSIDDQIDRGVALQIVQEAMDRLPPLEQEVLQLYYLDELNLNDIGERFHYCRERIRQIRHSALERLRRYLKSTYPVFYQDTCQNHHHQATTGRALNHYQRTHHMPLEKTH